MVVPDETSDGAACLAERCRQEVAKVCVVLRGETIRPTASFGVAEALGATSAETLINRADAALYEAKNAGRNAVRVCRGDATALPDVLPTSPDAPTAAMPALPAPSP